MSMTYHHWAPGAHIIYIFIAVNIVNMGALGSLDKWRIAVHIAIGTDRAVYAAGH
jgi:hypothetical protein